MQRLFLIFLILMLGMINAYCAYLNIELLSGPGSSFSLNDIEEITFSEDQLSIHIVSGTSELFDLIDIVQITFSDEVSIEDKVKFLSQIPFEFLKNHPNPFNPTTTISFATTIAGFTEVVVYNSRGQRVRTLLSQELDAGHHSLVWDGKNEQNRLVSSGVYMYRISVDGLQKINKMLLLK